MIRLDCDHMLYIWEGGGRGEEEEKEKEKLAKSLFASSLCQLKPSSRLGVDLLFQFAELCSHLGKL